MAFFGCFFSIIVSYGQSYTLLVCVSGSGPVGIAIRSRARVLNRNRYNHWQNMGLERSETQTWIPASYPLDRGLLKLMFFNLYLLNVLPS